jgi:hypothetical protein
MVRPMSTSAPQPLTFETFLTLEREPPHEFDGARVADRTGGSLNRLIIATNHIEAPGRRLRPPAGRVG